MSYRPRGRGRGGGAGNQLDRLIKLCSNSKKTTPPVSRFGSFPSSKPASTPVAVCDAPKEEKSRFSSFKKRPRIQQPTTPTPANNTLPTHNIVTHDDPFFSAHTPLSEFRPPTTTIYKPRKFFKSRDPIEVTVDPTKPPKVHPYNPPDLQPKSYSNKNAKTLRNATNVSPPTSSSLSTGVSPPIKLRIFKDKKTSKLVSVSDAPVASTTEETTNPLPIIPKPGKKRGRKPKVKTENAAIIEDNEMTAEIEETPVRPKGRMTRNSTRLRGANTDESEAQDSNTNHNTTSTIMPELYHSDRRSLDQSEFQNPDFSTDQYHHSSSYYDSQTPQSHVDPSANNTKVKNLEEDAEFQKLSEMLSSMEEESSRVNQPVSQYSAPMNLSNNSTTTNSSVHSQSSYGTPEGPYIPTVPKITPSDNFTIPQPAPVDRSSPPKSARDIRSILEDDWDESYDEDSPRKTPGHLSTSPPKVTRFDISGMDRISPQHYYSTSHQGELESHQEFSGQIPPTGGSSHPPQHFSSSPYAMKNLLSSPEQELRRPTLTADSGMESTNSSGGGTNNNNSQPMDTEDQNSEEPENLVCHNKASEDSQICSQEMSSSGQSSQSSSQNSNVIKKASIFKSRGQTSTVSEGKGGKKRLALYKHKFGQGNNDEEEQKNGAATARNNPTASTLFDDFGEDEEPCETDESDLRLRKLSIKISGGNDYSSNFVQDESNGSKVTCKKEAKKLFTVVRNVKPIHELQESGEFHEFDGDVWYILEDLKNTNPMTIRCLSAITLATRCMEPAFRMHLRAHGTVAEFCKELEDAPQHATLALLASTVLFVLSQDRLNMDLDTETLRLILALSKSEAQEFEENPEIARNRQRVEDLCNELRNRGHATHIKMGKITASELALETLLYLTSKRAGEWVKHELRSLGGLDYIVVEVSNSLEWIRTELENSCNSSSETILDRMRKVDRCLQVLQQVTFNHEDNQRYLLGVSQRKVSEDSNEMVKCHEASPRIFNDLFCFCIRKIEVMDKNSEVAGVLREVLFSVLRHLVNMSHDYRGIVLGSEILLSLDGFYELTLHSMFQMPIHFPDEKVFDLLMHSLCMLLNLVEYSKSNRKKLLNTHVTKNLQGNYQLVKDSDEDDRNSTTTLLDVFVEMFLCRERAAKKEEQHTDNILDKGAADKASGASTSGSQNSNASDKNSQDSEGSSVQDVIDKLIQTAGKHMENSLIAAYIALLLGYLIMDDPDSATHVRNAMPTGNFLPLMTFLKKLFNFMSITSSASGSSRGLKATAIALKFFAKADPKANEELKKMIPE